MAKHAIRRTSHGPRSSAEISKQIINIVCSWLLRLKSCTIPTDLPSYYVDSIFPVRWYAPSLCIANLIFSCIRESVFKYWGRSKIATNKQWTKQVCIVHQAWLFPLSWTWMDRIGGDEQHVEIFQNCSSIGSSFGISQQVTLSSRVYNLKSPSERGIFSFLLFVVPKFRIFQHDTLLTAACRFGQWLSYIILKAQFHTLITYPRHVLDYQASQIITKV
jgi:hypothetical protein